MIRSGKLQLASRSERSKSNYQAISVALKDGNTGNDSTSSTRLLQAAGEQQAPILFVGCLWREARDLERREGIRFRSDPIRRLGTRERNVGRPPRAVGRHYPSLSPSRHPSSGVSLLMAVRASSNTHACRVHCHGVAAGDGRRVQNICPVWNSASVVPSRFWQLVTRELRFLMLLLKHTPSSVQFCLIVIRVSRSVNHCVRKLNHACITALRQEN